MAVKPGHQIYIDSKIRMNVGLHSFKFLFEKIHNLINFYLGHLILLGIEMQSNLFQTKDTIRSFTWQLHLMK